MTRKSLSVIITLALIVSVSIAQNCNNPLLGIYNLPGLSNPISGAGFPYCQNLQNGQSCCSPATVGTFQGLVNGLAAELQSAAGARDAYLAQIRNNYLTQYQNLANTLQSYSGDIPAIAAQNSTLGNNLTSEANTINEISNRLTNINNDFNGAMRDYQDARRECFVDLLRVQASAWCLACDPNYAAYGVRNNGAIRFSNSLIDDISSDCYDYLEAAERFNPLIQARQSYERLENLTDYMAQFANTNVVPDTILPAVSITTRNATQRTVTTPAGCTDDDNCAFQGNNLFPGGVLNQTLAANGAGLIGGADIAFGQLGAIINNTSVVVVAPAIVVNNSTVVDNAPATAPAIVVNNSTVVDNAPATAPAVVTSADNNGRLLQNAAQTFWSPDLDNTGLAFNVAADPAGVMAASPAAINNNNDNSGSSLTFGLITIASLTMAAIL